MDGRMTPARHKHPSLEMYAQNPIVEIGDEIEFLEPGAWALDPEHKAQITVPAGARATVVPWTIPGWPMGIAFLVEGHQHPQYQVFPMLTFTPKASRYPDKYRLLPRKDAA
jgi:hypothetical protein